MRTRGQCCHPLVGFLESPHTPGEWAASISLGIVLVVLLGFVITLLVAFAGGGDCDSAFWTSVMTPVLRDCADTPATNMSASAKALDRGEFNFGIGLTQCKGSDALGRGPNILVPFCVRTSPTIRLDELGGPEDIEYSAFKIIGNEAGKLRMCARMKLAIDFPGTSTFDGLVMERFNGYTVCSAIAVGNTTKVIEKTIAYNCGDKTRAELAGYLWTLHTAKTRYFTATCTTPSSGGLLTLTSTIEEHEWCNDLYGILKNSTAYTHAWAQDTILHDLFTATIPTCGDYIPLTLYNSYNTSCRV